MPAGSRDTRTRSSAGHPHPGPAWDGEAARSYDPVMTPNPVMNRDTAAPSAYATEQDAPAEEELVEEEMLVEEISIDGMCGVY